MMLRARPVFCLLLTALLLQSPGRTLAAETVPALDLWLGMYLGKLKIGYTNIRQSREEFRGAPAIRTESSSRTELTVLGQTAQCAWLKVRTAQNTVGWVARRSGGVELVQLHLPCERIPALSVPSPTPRPTARPQPTQPPASGGLPADKGCYLFQNHMGVELNVTISDGRGWSDNFKVAPNAERLYCLAPGRYTYTIDAPPPWADINGTLDVQAGKHYRFPVQGRP
ncbi:MAG: hypothetical protein N2439_16080 [Anaerolineae bacterium]|nr:hypothetical protein [Anaerolineae bacterium]